MFAANAGMQAAGGVLTNTINSAINYAFGKKMAAYNFELNEKAAENADARRRALYGDFETPMAKIRLLKEAGLSPSLYAGGELGGGIGSTAGAQGAGASGASIPSYAGTSIDSINDTKLANAQARLMNAQADELEGKNFQANLNAVKVFSEAGLNDAAAALKNAETSLKNIELKYADETAHYSLEKLKHNTEQAKNDALKAFWDAEDKGLEFKFNQETFDKRKEQLANICAEIAARTALEKSNVRLTDEQRAHIKDFAKAALDQAAAHTQSAEAYGEYVQNMDKYLTAQLDVERDKIKLGYWQMGVGAITNILQAGASMAGSGMFSAVTKVIGL